MCLQAQSMYISDVYQYQVIAVNISDIFTRKCKIVKYKAIILENNSILKSNQLPIKVFKNIIDFKTKVFSYN
jgi:hypothetical protein